MKRLWGENGDRDDLGRRLRTERPEPPLELMLGLEERIRTYRNRSTGRLRLALAAGVSAALLVPLAAFGALGGAPSTIGHVLTNVVGIANVGSPHPNSVAVGATPAKDQYKNPKRCLNRARARYQAAVAAAYRVYVNTLNSCHTAKCRQKAKARYLAAVAAAKARYRADKEKCR